MMKNNFDKKLIVIFIIMIVIVGLIFYVLKNQESVNTITSQTDQKANIETMEVQIKKIEALMKDVNNMFSSNTFDSYTEGLQSYINLPLNIGSVGNKYPFGNYGDQ